MSVSFRVLPPATALVGRVSAAAARAACTPIQRGSVRNAQNAMFARARRTEPAASGLAVATPQQH